MSAPADRTNAIAIAIAALDLPIAERAAFLDQACGDNAPLRQLVEALVRAHQFAPALGPLTSPGRKPTIVLSIPVTEKPGDKISHYKLLQQIGEGGCGVVYMAEQEQPVRRRVALKVIKLGMDTKQVIARFEAERQALALMDHPNIAKVLDAGATETGRPYFVMELVRGVKITEYCDKNNLPTHQRLELFTQVCRAIQHAHQKGIIHRDIKPSNILVTLHDGVPVPKVIDFGIAKATEQRLTDKTLFTALDQFIGTPAYMSPEQAELSGLDIDTRSDIYSLGVLLYELLTGQMPFDPKALRVAGLDEMRRIIRENDPVKPSTKLSSLTAANQSTVARQRQVEALKLVNLVRGDLDWIVMKALEKDRTRRYETATGLARDIERHLTNEPVMARPPSQFYQFSKLVRRNKLVFASAGAVAAALILGLGLSTVLFIRETRAHELANSEAKKSAEVARFLTEMLKGVAPSVALGRDTKLLREILDQTAQRVGRELTNQPAVAAELLITVGSAYYDVGDYPKAQAIYEQMLRIKSPPSSSMNALVAASLDGLGRVHHERRDFATAETLKRQALAIRRTLFTNDHPDVAQSLVSLSDTIQSGGKLKEAEQLAREGLAMWRRLRGSATPDRDVATALNTLGGALHRVNKLAEAEEVQRAALSMWRDLGETDSPALATALMRLVGVLEKQGRLAEAETTFREALAMRRRMLGDNHPLVHKTCHNFLRLLGRRGKLDEAEELCRGLLANCEKLSPNGSWEIAGAFLELAYVLAREDKILEAQSSYRNSLAMQLRLTLKTEEDSSPDGLNTAAWLLATADLEGLRDGKRAVQLAEKAASATGRTNVVILDTWAAACAEAGQFERAVSVQKEAMALLQDEGEKRDYASRLQLYAMNKPYHEPGFEQLRASALADAASDLLMEGKFAETEAPAREGLAILEKNSPEHWRTFNSRSLLGGALLGQKKLAEAEPLLRSGYAGMKAREAMIPTENKLELKKAIDRLVQLCEAKGDATQAAEWRHTSAEFNPAKDETRPSAPKP